MRCLGLVALLFVLLALPGCADSEELKPDDSEGEMNWEEFKRETRKSIEYMQPEYRKRMEDLGLDPINMKRPEQLSEENKKLRLRKRREAAIQPKNQPTSQPKNQEKWRRGKCLHVNTFYI